MKDIFFRTILSTVFLLNTCITITLGQTEVTRYTPNGSSVRAYNEIPEMSSDDKEDYSIQVATYYPQATELNSHSATTSYNCHAYAWHISEGGDNVWIGYYPGQTADEDIYWTDESYLNQSVETGAEKISYYNGNHSAIQTSTAGTYKSKWGEGPLMQHARNYGPTNYNMNNRRYYVRPYISGTNTVCFSNRTFTLYNRPPGSAVTWTRSSNLIYISGQGTDNYTVRSKGSGNGWIKANISGATFIKTFWVGKPSQPTTNPSGYPTIEMALNERKTFFAHSNGSPTSYHWWINGSSVDIIFGSNSYRCVMYGEDLGWSNFYVTSTNQCGTSSTGGGSINVSKSGGGLPVPLSLTIYPNPTNNILNIEFQTSDNVINNSLKTKEIFLYNKMMKLVKHKIISGNLTTINMSNLKADVYMLKIMIGNEIYEEKVIVTE